MGITLWQHLSDSANAMAHRALQDVRSLEQWQQLRPNRHRQFMHAMGLDPLPPRCDLALTECGTFAGDGFRAQKLAFQILPQCWISACLYLPDPLPTPRVPGVLYVCGHASLGAHHYQSHPIMWARRGYACLIVDTIEQNDNPGEHHASHTGDFAHWLSLGYTAAGGELWSAMRAIDVLAGDVHVDAARIGATGVSGGGAVSFHLAIADERVRAVSSLCGISTPRDAITNRHVMGHCGCFYPNNLYQHDTSEYAALIAPRPALFCFADHDPLFHPREVCALTERTRSVYALYDADEHCELFTTRGPHGDKPAFDEATCNWFDRHLAGEPRPMLPRGERELSEPATSVFDGQPPQPNHLHLLPELLSPRGAVPLPESEDDWAGIRERALEAMRAQTMPNWSPTNDRPRLTFEAEWQWGGAGETTTPLHQYTGRVDGMDMLLHTVIPAQCEERLLVSVAAPGESWMYGLARAASGVDRKTTAYGSFEPRLAGADGPAFGAEPEPPGSWPESMRTTHLRAMAIAGTTPITMMFHDVMIAVETLFAAECTRDHAIYLHGRGEAAVACLYAALFDRRVAGVVAEDLPGSHVHGAPMLGVLRVFDLPQAVGLMAPHPVALITPGHGTWTWANRVYGRLGIPPRFINKTGLRDAMDQMRDSELSAATGGA